MPVRTRCHCGREWEGAAALAALGEHYRGLEEGQGHVDVEIREPRPGEWEVIRHGKTGAST